jgi:hypothetical protein
VEKKGVGSRVWEKKEREGWKRREKSYLKQYKE